MKEFLKLFIPPVLINIARKLRSNKYGWSGKYSSWEEAKSDSVGYDSDKILETVKNSLLKVKNGEAIYERDSVIFDEIQYSWPLLAGLMLSSSKFEGKLRVLDFGGSLGSSYYQNKKFLDKLDEVSWSIVEQDSFVKVGKEYFEDSIVKFYYTVEDTVVKENPNILVLSSVLQYIENPYELLDNILKHSFEYILIDRTPFSKMNQDIIKLQTVSPNIYEASYPCWFFDRDKFVCYFTDKGYSIVEEFKATDEEGDQYLFKGLILEKNND